MTSASQLTALLSTSAPYASAPQPEFYLPALKLISYRGPGATGNVSNSLEPIVRRLHTKLSWIALVGQPQSGGAGSRFTFHTPTATRAVLDEHAAFCSDYLRPLFHGMTEGLNFDVLRWKSFKQLNDLVASASLNVSSQSFPTIFWTHDYELALVAPIISAHAGVIPCHFWHVPWPAPSAFLSSAIIGELLEALLGNKLIGFQTNEYATNFLNTVQEIVPKAKVDVLKMTVKRGRDSTRVVVMPYGIDGKLWQDNAKHNRPLANVLARKYRASGQLVLGIDRLDATKGLVQKMDGLAQFLCLNTSWHGRFQYVQLTQVQDQEANTGLLSELNERVSYINGKFSTDAWKPIIHLESNLDQAELAAWYQAADIFTVNSVIEGLSLVAKEYIASRLDDQGVLLLSKGSGSITELGQAAVTIDPRSKQSFADGLLEALSMGKEERRRRMLLMKDVVGWNGLQDWAIRFLSQALA